MFSYRVLGGLLRSELEFPELPGADPGAPATWRFAVGPEVPTTGPFDRLGSDTVRAAGDVVLSRAPGGFRLTYPDTGTYDVLETGSLVRWYPPAAPPYEPLRFLEAVRIDLLGRVLSVALHAAGIEALHGSAVAFDGETAVAFLAPKFHGKSTLASALVARGARLLTDDTLPLENGEPPRARPGVHSLRLWRDAAHHLAGRLAPAELGPWGKFQSSGLPADRLMERAVPLRAAYLLAPSPPVRPDAAATARDLLPPLEAALSLIGHAKIAVLLGPAGAARLLAWGVQVARSVPVYRLRFPRDFARLDGVAERLQEWHGAACAEPAAVGS
jgi:hypothetical protein